MAEPTITFTLDGKTITATETPLATVTATYDTTQQQSTTASLTTTTPSSSSSQEDHSSSASSTTAASSSTTAASSSSVSGSSTSTTSSSNTPTTLLSQTSTAPSFTTLPIPKVTISSCIQATTTISNMPAAQALASGCSIFSGDIVVPTGVSTPIDFSGMQEVEGSLICEGSAGGGFNAFGSNSLTKISGSLTVENTAELATLSFPVLVGLGSLQITDNAEMKQVGFPSLNAVFGPIEINGSFTSILLPLLQIARNTFNLDSTEDLNCSLVAPDYDYTIEDKEDNAIFQCVSISAAGTDFYTNNNGSISSAVHATGPRGFDWKDKVIVSVVCGVVGLVCLILGIGTYYYRRQIKTTIDLVGESYTRPRSNVFPNSPSNNTPFWVSRPGPEGAPVDPRRAHNLANLKRQYRELYAAENDREDKRLPFSEHARLTFIERAIVEMEGHRHGVIEIQNLYAKKKGTTLRVPVHPESSRSRQAEASSSKQETYELSDLA